MAKLKVKKGDTVLVIAGKDKGAKGKVIQAYPDTQRVLVEGVNRIKKHTKVSSTTSRPGWGTGPKRSPATTARSSASGSGSRGVPVRTSDDCPGH
jgi:large subunit ribosomal protein L24